MRAAVGEPLLRYACQAYKALAEKNRRMVFADRSWRVVPISYDALSEQERAYWDQHPWNASRTA